MGPALFDNPTRRLSPGAECLKDYLLKDFPADMLREDIETSVPLARVLKITRDLIQDLRAGMEERDAFVKNYEISKMSAVEAANNVIELAKTMDDEEKGRRKKQHATIWCANELKKLEMKGAELAGQVARASTSVGKKINSLLVHTKDHDLLSRTFLEALEAWQDLDAAAVVSQALQRPPMPDPYADTMVMSDAAPAVGQMSGDGVADESQPLPEAEQADQDTHDPAAVEPIGSQGSDEPADEQPSAVEALSVLFGNHEGTDEQGMDEQADEQPSAVEALSVPLGNQGTDEQGMDEQAANEQLSAVEALSVPLGNQGTDEQAADEQPSAVEALSVPLGNQGTGTDEQAPAVEPSVSIIGNLGTDEQAPAVEPSVSIGNLGTDEQAPALEPSVSIGNLGTEEQAPAVEASVSIGNQGTDEQAPAVQATVTICYIANQGTDEQAAPNTQLDPEPASPGTAKKDGNTGAGMLCRIATPQKDRGQSAAYVECKEDPIAVDASDAEDDRLLDAMLQTHLEADMLPWFMYMWHAHYTCIYNN